MPRTSDKSELILEFVSNFIQENGYAPSVREIGAGVGLRSTASVSYHLRALQDKGLLQGGESKGRKRAIATSARAGRSPWWAWSRQACPSWRWRTRRGPWPGTGSPAASPCGSGAIP